MRETIRGLLSSLHAAALAIGTVLVTAIIVRFCLTLGFDILVKGVPALILVLWRDPVVIVALVIAIIIVWANPWDKAEGPPVRRGRELVSLRKARQRAQSPTTAPRAGRRHPQGPDDHKPS
ncbi:MAG: hypothetical protein NTY19_07760 [Planctomycetota bacterium]|nr:hypothetical protein [Planctomycetota bacterium]